MERSLALAFVIEHDWPATWGMSPDELAAYVDHIMDTMAFVAWRSAQGVE